MDRELIQSWLQLPPGDWPPDHYTLLGLEPGEEDVARIEQHVYERMQQLRSYQLTHPELATKAMNSLAQALVCLTDPGARKAYDRQLLSKEVVETNGLPAPAEEARNGSEPAVVPSKGRAEQREAAPPETASPSTEDQRFFDWQFDPPPQRQPRNPSAQTPFDFMSKETVENLGLPDSGAADTMPDIPPVPSLDQGAPPADAELLSKFSRLELRSKRALYSQITRTRQLLWAWKQVGKYLSRPARLVNRPAEATDLIHHMGVIRELLPSMTPLMGEAGHPGYLVLALARQQMIVPTLQTLLPSQREALARDWQTGHDLLWNVRQLLRQELQVVRRRRGWRHALRLIGASVRDHPGVLLLLMALVAVNLASSDILDRWPQQLICLGALAAIRIAFWLYTFQPLRIPSIPQPERKVRLSKKNPRTQRQPDSSRA